MQPDTTATPAEGFDDSLPVGAIVHYYRGAMTRSNARRNIVDNTTDWAVAATAGMLSFGISGEGSRHIILFAAHFFILMFLMIEARRYSYYIAIDWRVRMIERHYYANVLLGLPEAASGAWRRRLAEEILHPHLPLDFWSSFSIRLRRTYVWIFLILSFAWVARVATYPRPAASLGLLWEQSGITALPGWCLWAALALLWIVFIAALRRNPAARRKLEREGFAIG
ncbi:MAG: DUF2270 domain-containing protein [bacterium]|nr:DUF2270 domain-containing protein [bacterium]